MNQRLLFVRAVNVGGAKLPMAEFRELLAELGGSNPQTYIASGNAIVDIESDVDAYDRAVEAAMKERYGWFREVISRTAREVESALNSYPFEVVESRFAYVVFLAGAPEPGSIEQAKLIDTGEDQWKIADRDAYVQYAGGAGQANPGIDKALRKLKVPNTARNLNTVRAMLDLAASRSA